MTWLYVLEVVVVVAAFMGMLWLRREGDRVWALHCPTWALCLFPIRYITGLPPTPPTVTVRIIADTSRFVAGMRAAAAAAENLGAALREMPAPEDDDL